MALGRGEGYPRTLAEETQAFLPFNSFVSPIPLPNVENSYEAWAPVPVDTDTGMGATGVLWNKGLEHKPF